MDQAGYEQSLLKAQNYFLQDKFSLFLDEFARAFEFNNDCFNDNLNVFRFSLANYSLTNNKTINEFNRFILHLPQYLGGIKDKKDKEALIVKIEGMIDKKYSEVCLYDKVMNYDSFNNYCILLMQLYSLANLCVRDHLISSASIIDGLLLDAQEKMKKLEKAIKWTGTRYKVHFVYLPQKPKEFFKELEEKILSLRQKNIEC